MNTIVMLIQREIRRIVHDSDLVMILLVAPVFYAFLYPSIYLHKAESEVAIAVVDRDHSAYSRSLIRQWNAHPLLLVHATVPDEATAQQFILRHEAEAFITIPAGVEARLRSDRAADLQLFVNNSRFLVGNDINRAVNDVLFTEGKAIRTRMLEMKGYGSRPAGALADPVTVDMRPLYNTSETYGDFLIPGILIIILHQTLLIGLSESMAKEREEGTVGAWTGPARGSVFIALAGKGMLYLLLYGIYAALFFGLHFPLFSLPFRGSVTALAFLTLLLLMNAVVFGILFASFFQKKIATLQWMIFSSYPLFILSGYSWPLDAMPSVLKNAALLLPTTSYFQAMVRITQMGAAWGNVLPEILRMSILLIIGGVAVGLRISSLEKNVPSSPITIAPAPL